MARTAARRSALGLTAAGVLALGLVWLRARGGDPREERLAPERPERATEATRAPLDAAAPLAPERPTSERNAAVAAAAEGEEDGPSAAELLEVRVTSSGAPVAGARVALGPAYWFDRNVEAQHASQDCAPTEEVLAAGGTTKETDAQGVVRFAVAPYQSRVAARLADGFATCALEAFAPGPVTLELEPDPAIRVLVVDEAGQPRSGIPVGLGYADMETDFVRVPSGADGIALLRAAEHRATLVRRGARVTLSLYLAEPVTAAVDPAEPPEDPIVLRLPPTGSLALELVDEDGARWTRRSEASLWISARMHAELGLEWQRPSLYRVVDDGRLVVDLVGLGLELQLRLEAEGREPQTETFAGPRAPGERREVRVRIAEPAILLAARLFDGAGEPLRDGHVRVHGPHWSFLARLDGEGRLRTTLERWYARDGVLPLELVAEGDDGRAARVTIDPVVLGLNDLGDVVLEELPLIAGGTVVDEQGEPIAGARVELYAGATEGVSYSGESLHTRMDTDGRGRFAHHGHPLGAPIGIQVDAREYVPFGPYVVPAGSADVELVLRRGGWIEYEVLFDGSLRPHVSVEPRPHRMSGSMKRMGPLVPGVYSVVYSQYYTDLAGSIPGIVVVAGETTVDPRLAPLDLRGLVPSVALAIADSDGAPVPDPVIAIEDRGRWAELSTKRDGERLRIWASPLPLRLRIEAPGFRATELTDVRGDREVVLARGPAVRWVVDGKLPALAAGWSLEGWILRAAEGIKPAMHAFPLTEVGSTVFVSSPGTYEVGYWLVWSHAGKELDRVRFYEDHAPRIDIADAEAEQVLRIPAPSLDLVRELEAYIDDQE